jgi:hypothetical protein
LEVEWRFAYFRATNAEAVVNATTAMLWDLANQGKPANEKVANYIKGLKARLEVLFPSGHPLRHTQPQTGQAAHPTTEEPSGGA